MRICNARLPFRHPSGLVERVGPGVLLVCLLGFIPSAVIHAADLPSVKAVTIENAGPGRLDRTFVLEHIGTVTDQPLDRRQIANDVKALLATGAFSSVRVQAEEVEGGVNVIYMLWLKHRIDGPVEVKIKPDEDSYYGESKIQDWLELNEGDRVDDQTLGVAARRIEKEYRDRYFPDARVEWEIKEKDREAGLAGVTVKVDEGKRAKIKRTIFVGNEEISEKELRNAAKLRAWYDPRGWFGAKRYDPASLEIQRMAVKEFYLNRGFLDVKVDAPEVKRLEEGGVEIVVTIDEGTRYRFGTVELTGATLFPEDDLRNLLRAKTGDTASARTIKDTMQAVKDYYGRRGYTRTAVRPVLDPDSRKGIVDIEFALTEGRLTTIRNIRIRGNTRTRDKVIRRELLVAPGDIFNEVKVRRSERVVRNLGYFSDVRSYPLTTDVPGEEDLVLEVEEKRTGQFLLGVGFSSVDKASGWIELSQGNFDLWGWPYFTGGGQKLKLSAMVGDKRRQYRIQFKEPWFMDRPLALGFELYRDEKEYDDYDLERTGGAVSLGKRLPGRGNRITFRYGLEESIVTDVSDTNIYYYVESPQESFSFMRDEETTKSSLGVTLRHRTFNHPFVPTSGDNASLSAEVSGGPLGADLDIYEVSLDLGHYEPLWFRHVFRISANYKVVDAYGDTDEVPLAERLFLGGGRTLRGFKYREVGPKVSRDSGSDTYYKPAGGGSRVMGTAEYTVPLVPMVRFAAFYDIGNVWREPYELELSDLASAYGVGIRLDFPQFPIRLDWGWPVDRDDEFTRTDKFSLWIGIDY